MTQTPYVLVPSQPKRKPWPLIVAALVVVLIAAGVAAYFLWPRSLMLTGKVVIGSGNLSTDGGTCSGGRGYSDIREGAQVIVTDSTGATIALGALGMANWTSTACEFPFSVEVPAGKGIYGVTVGTRKGLQVTEAELAKPVDMSIGM